MGLVSLDPQRDLPIPCVANHEYLFDVVGKDLQRQLPFLHPPFPALQEAAPAPLHRTEHTLHDGPQMVHRKPTNRVTLAGPKRDDPSGPAACPTGRVHTETQIRCPVFVSDQLAVGPRGIRLVTQDLAHRGEVFEEAGELSAVMPVPPRGGKRVHHPGVHIDADV